METEMIQRGEGNLLEADVDALVNTVNTVGVMGKGLALQFKRAWPEMFKAYQRAAKAGEISVGHMHVWPTDAVSGPKYIINFPTKKHWRGNSRIEFVEEGLRDLVKVVSDLGIESIAVPPLGCGNGGLAWPEVRSLITRAFEDAPVDVRLFAPSGAPEAKSMPDARERKPLNANRTLLLTAMRRYQEYALEFPSHLELQKLAYFLQEAGQPLRLRFGKGLYGPYADNLRHVLNELEGHYVDGYGDGTDPVTQFRPIEVRTTTELDELDSESQQRLDRVIDLCADYASPFGMELLASVHWVMNHADPPATTADEAAKELWRWNARKCRFFTADHVATAWARLAPASVPVG